MDKESGKTDIGDNTAVVMFASEQAGYLAGYSAVKDGKTQLGFIGDEKKSVVMDYGYGFLQGADAAAKETGAAVSVNYRYCTLDDTRESIPVSYTHLFVVSVSAEKEEMIGVNFDGCEILN